jgi:hypothetical protein
MTARPLALALCSLACAASAAIAQPPPPPPPPPAQAPATTPPAAPPNARPREPRRPGQPVNVKIEVTITDQRGGAQPLRKTVNVVTGDGMFGFIRSTANYAGIGSVPLNVDAEPEILPNGKIRTRLNLQYSLPGANSPAGGEAGKDQAHPVFTEIRDNLSLILENGKPLIAAQSADPVGDRQVTIEIKATILR